MAKVKKKPLLEVKEAVAKISSPLRIEKKEIEKELKFDRVILPILISPEPAVNIETKESMEFEKPSPKYFNPKPKQDPKAKKKKKKGKKFRQISSNLFVGFIFLGIAIVLAFLKLPTLVMLFGLASIIFLAIGLKKIWKKKRRRSRFENIFKSKK